MAHQQDYFTSDLVERLRVLRLTAGLSTQELAQACHVSASRVRSWEHSPHPGITLRQLADYALACGVVPFTITYEEGKAS